MKPERENPLGKYLDPKNDNQNTGCVKRVRQGGRGSAKIWFWNGEESVAFPYFDFRKLRYSAKNGMTLFFTTGKVTLTGKNLAELKSDIHDDKITDLIIARGPPEREDAIHIETITFEHYEDGEKT